MMDALLEQLHDIEGIDTISLWPLALGWWMVVILSILFITFIVWVFINRIIFNRSWKKETRQKLVILEKNLAENRLKETVIELSEYLRRIALKRFSRKECAGLLGKEWLEWLALHDPKRFDWRQKGLVLIEIPYTGKEQSLSMNQVKELIYAVKSWVA